MDEDGSTWKLVAGYFVWLLASAAIALIAGLLVGAVATGFGVESQSASSQSLIAAVAVAGFVALAALPFLLRRRMSRSASENPD
jgi:hypothetical protein